MSAVIADGGMTGINTTGIMQSVHRSPEMHQKLQMGAEQAKLDDWQVTPKTAQVLSYLDTVRKTLWLHAAVG